MEDGFQKIGKKMPYEIPEGFFDRVTNETLLKAREREKARKKRIFLLRHLAAAAIFTGIAVAGAIYLQPLKPEQPTHVTSNTSDIQYDKANIQYDTSSAIKKENKTSQQQEIRELLRNPDSAAAETMDIFLASISDEELLQWAIALKNDLITE